METKTKFDITLREYNSNHCSNLTNKRDSELYCYTEAELKLEDEEESLSEDDLNLLKQSLDRVVKHKLELKTKPAFYSKDYKFVVDYLYSKNYKEKYRLASGECVLAPIMNSEAKSIWLRALESDKYIQNFEGLRVKENKKTMTYCAIGVLYNEIIDLVDAEWVRVDYNSYDLECNNETLIEYLNVVHLCLFHKDIRRGISFLNDTEQLCFKEIANLIKEQM